MTSSKTLKKIVSIGASLMLAIGGSLVAASPAQATGGQPTITSVPTSTLAGATVRVGFTFPAQYTHTDNITYDLMPANYNSMGNAYGDPQASIQACQWNAPLPAAQEIVAGFGGGGCSAGGSSNPTIVSATGNSSLDLAVDYVLPNGSPYDVGISHQLSATARYLDVANSSAIYVKISQLVTVLTEITNTSASNVTHDSATINYTTSYNGNAVGGTTRIGYIVRAASSAVSTAAGIEAVASTSGHWENTSFQGASTLNLTQGLSASTAYAVDFVLLNVTNNTQAVSAVKTVSFTTTAPPASRPGPVTGLTATAGDASATVSWTAPSSDGGAAIDYYTVEKAVGFPGSWQSAGTTSTTSKTVTGLTNGQYYYFRVTAHNSVGDSYYAENTNSAAIPQAGVVAPASYTLTFDLQGGSITNTNTTFAGYSSGASVNLAQRLTAYMPSKSGYTFSGWYSMAIGGIQLTTVTMNADTTVYARWTAQQQQAGNNLTLNLQGGNLNGPTFLSGLTGGALDIRWTVGSNPTRSGFNFAGWTESVNGPVVTTVNMALGDKTLYASWTSAPTGVSYPTCAGQTSFNSITATATSMSRTGTHFKVFNGNASFNNCTIPTTGYGFARYVNGNLVGSVTFAQIASLVTSNTIAANFASLETSLGRQLIPGDVVTYKYWTGLQASPTTQPATFTLTFTITDGTVTSTDSTDVTDVAAEPLPVWASNIIQSIPTLTKRLVTTGGSVALTGGDYADLKSVTIGGKSVTYKLEANGHVNIPVPAGEAGKTADIVIVFAGGTMTVQDGIKYVAQTNVAKVAERPISIAAGAKKITEAVADEIRHAAFANMNNNSIACVAYASNNTAKAKAAAKLTAVQACGIATKANPGLKASEISVIVNKAKAKKQAVGIKVFKQN
jgi:uncharacterized repeat protein (TIGR02543 family)